MLTRLLPLAALIAAPAFAATQSPESSAPTTATATPNPPSAAEAPEAKPAFKTVPVTLTTSAGTITIALEIERAPVTAGNFLRYIDQKRLDGTTFYRAYTYADGSGGLIQGGARNDPKRVLKPILHESTSRTGLTHDDGAISMARGAPGSADGDFFIILGGMKGLDANPAADGDNQGFAVFGHVVEGMDVVRAITGLPRNPSAGVGAMKGQMLAAPIRIISARRATAPAK